MRAPWTGPSGDWSWTTFWLNFAAFIVIVRFLVGAGGIEWGTFAWNPGELDGGLVAAVLGSLGALYGYRRTTENGKKPADPAS